MPKNQFVSEYLGQFVDDYGSVFDLSKNIFIKNERPSNDIFIGIDWAVGKNGDYTCVSAFDNYSVQAGLDYTNNMTPTEQIQWISNIIKSKYANKHIMKIVCETNSIGNVFISDLKNSLGDKWQIEEFTTTNSSKREIIEYLIKLINEEKVKFINNSELYSQLSSYQMEITNSGAITYNSMQGKHDDFIMASAFALNEIRKLESNNNYKISFGNRTNNHKSKYNYEKYH